MLGEFLVHHHLAYGDYAHNTERRSKQSYRTVLLKRHDSKLTKIKTKLNLLWPFLMPNSRILVLIRLGTAYFVQLNYYPKYLATLYELRVSCQTRATQFGRQIKPCDKSFHIFHIFQSDVVLELQVPFGKYFMPSPVRKVAKLHYLSF